MRSYNLPGPRGFCWVLVLCLYMLPVPGLTQAALPFEEAFESGVLSNYWSVSSSPSGVVLKGMATVHEGALRLTESKTYPNYYFAVDGHAWYADKVPVSSGFTNTFTFQIEELLDRDQHGLAFVIQNDALEDWGDRTYAFWGGGSYDFISNSLAIEFDTYEDSYFTDLAGHHISVHTRGSDLNSPDHAYSLGSTTTTTILNDAAAHVVKVEYEPGVLRIYLDEMAAPALTVPVNLSSTLTLDAGKAWVGFTARTGDQIHEITDWTFAGGTDSFSFNTFAATEGRVGITDQYEPVDGAKHIIMDYPSTSGFSCVNNLDLSIDLLGRSNVWLKYWQKTVGEFNPLTPTGNNEPIKDHNIGEGVAISDNGMNWYSVFPTPGYGGTSNGFTETLIYLDDYVDRYAPDWTSTFEVRFKQYGYTSMPAEGLLMDKVSLFQAAAPVGQFPFMDSFEQGLMHAWWEKSGAVYLTGTNSAYAGGYGLTYGPDSSSAHIDLTVDLAGRSNVWLNFWCRNQNDDVDVVMPNTFSGTFNSDGVAISVDGVNWYKVLGLTTGEGSPADDQYYLFNANLDAVMSTYGLTYNAATKLRFQHRANYGRYRYWDDIAVLSQQLEFSTDLYSIHEGQDAVLTVLRKGSTMGSISVDYASSDDTADEGSDYTAVTGTLTFGNGVASNSISVPITDDTEYYEPDETFSVQLSNPQGGAELGGHDDAQVTILADPRAAFPFVEGFESQPEGVYWDMYWDGGWGTFSSSLDPHDGVASLYMYPVSSPGQAEATLTVNLLNQSNVLLRFWHKSNDTLNEVMPDSFVDRTTADGVAISADGMNWYKATGLTVAEGATTNYSLHEVLLDPLLATNGLTYNQNFKVRFQMFNQASGGGTTFFDDVSLSLAAGPLEIISPAVPTGMGVTAFSYQLEATNGMAPYTWSTTSSLPVGMTLNPNGLLSGLPEEEGSFPLHIVLVDQLFETTNRMFNLVIEPNPNRPPSIDGILPLSSVFNVPEGTSQVFSVTASDPEGSNLVYSWTWEGIPVGTASNAYTLLTAWGQAGTYTLQVTVSDGLWSNVRTNWAVTILADNDGDGMPNAWENLYGLDPWDTGDASQDADGDQLINLDELRHGLDPANPDMDGDSLPDGWEISYGFSPTSTVYDLLPTIEATDRGYVSFPELGFRLQHFGDRVYVSMASNGVAIMDCSNPSAPTLAGQFDTAGVAVDTWDESNIVYVADSTNGLVIVDATNPGSVVPLGQTELTGSAQDVVVQNGVAYLSQGPYGTEIVDVSIPSNPIPITNYINTGHGEVGGVVVQDDFLYAIQIGGVDVADISTPANPFSVFSENLAWGTDIELDGALLYAVHDDGARIYDISEGTNPVHLGDFQTAADTLWHVEVSNDYVFAPLYQNPWPGGTHPMVEFVDAADPSQPFSCGEIIASYSPLDVCVVSNFLYVLPYYGWPRLFIYELHFKDADRDLMEDAWEVEHGGSMAMDPYGDEDGDGIVNVGEFQIGSNPTNSDTDADAFPDGWEVAHGGNPVQPGTINRIDLRATFDTGGKARAVKVVNELAYVAADTNGMIIVDVADPSLPSQIGHYSGLDRAYDVDIQDNLAFMADMTGGLFKVDVTVPTNPVGLVNYNAGASLSDVVVNSNLAFTVLNNSFVRDLQIIDIYLYYTNQDLWMGDLDIGGTAYDLEFRSNLVYFAGSSSSSTVWIVDVSDPDNPSLLSQTLLPSNGFARGITLLDTTVCVADYHAGIRMVDVTNVFSPTPMAVYKNLAYANAVDSMGDLVFVAYDRNMSELDAPFGLGVVHVGDPASLQPLLHTNAFEGGEDLFVTSNLIYVAAGDDGLMVFYYEAPDHDLDFMSDDWEIEHWGDLAQNNPDADSDGDGIPNRGEAEYGLNPLSTDSDGDGLSDLWEVYNGYDPRFYNESVGGIGVLSNSIMRLAFLGLSNRIYKLEQSLNFDTWEPINFFLDEQKTEQTSLIQASEERMYHLYIDTSESAVFTSVLFRLQLP